MRQGSSWPGAVCCIAAIHTKFLALFNDGLSMEEPFVLLTPSGRCWPKAPVHARRNFLQILKFRRSAMNLSTAGGFYKFESIICSAAQTATDPKEPVTT